MARWVPAAGAGSLAESSSFAGKGIPQPSASALRFSSQLKA
jgi:hypothetical protein